MKYREFWISDRTFNVSEGLPSWRDGEQNIHTIDYAAYTDALKKLELLTLDRDNAVEQFFRLQTTSSNGIIELEKKYESALKMLEEMAGAIEEYQSQFERCGRPRILLGCWIKANDALDKYRAWLNKDIIGGG